MRELIDLADEVRVFERNALLKSAETSDSTIYFVESGALKLFINHENGEEQIIRFGYCGDLVVALDSFITGKPSDLCIQAIKKTKVHLISKKQFQNFVYQSTENQKRWIELLEGLVLQQMERELDLLTTSPKDRYLRVLQRSPKLFQEIPHKHIANYLRMSEETLSRLKKS